MNKPMRPREWFAVGVRLMGVWKLLDAVERIVAYFEMKLQFVSVVHTDAMAYLFHAGTDLVVGLFLLTVGTLIFWRDSPAPNGFEVVLANRSAGKSDQSTAVSDNAIDP